jgi:predicted phage tail protein
LIHTEYVTPYGYLWKNVLPGNYTLTVKATDNSGLVSTSPAVYVTVLQNKAPTVSITNPDNNAVYAAPATVTINATASDVDGSVYSVKFYNGTTYLKTNFTAPYTYTISNLAAGKYSLTVKATDNNGAETISATVAVTVKACNKAPTVSITTPANNTTFAARANVTVNALAADADGSIHSVKFYKGGTYLKTVFASPYTYTLSNLSAGKYTITAKATDNTGAETMSAPITLTVSSATVSNRPFAENDKTALNDVLKLKVYPNPETNLVNLVTGGLQNKPVTISIISASGVVMQTMRITSPEQTVQLDVSSLERGVYTIKLIVGEKVLYNKFVKF